jgi:hypothetical protein
MLQRRTIRGSVIVMLACAVALAAAGSAAAHEGEVHPAPAAGAGTQGALPPVVGGGGGAAAPAANPNAPAAGAQPAAPGAVGELPQVDPADANPVDVAADAGAAPDAGAAVEEIEIAAGQVVEPVDDGAPIEANAVPKVASPAAPKPVMTVDGGGTDGAGGGATAAPVAYATPPGALPFTGLGQTLLLILIAGVLVPGGVLLYCAARRGDLHLSRLHLSVPRFQWADPAKRPFQHIDSPDPARCTWLDD